MDKINIKDVIAIHSIFEQENTCESGVRDINMLDSAINSAFQSAFGEEIYLKKILIK